MATTKVGIAPMKVAQISKPGGDFEIVEREIPAPTGQVRIKVQAWAFATATCLSKKASGRELSIRGFLDTKLPAIPTRCGVGSMKCSPKCIDEQTNRSLLGPRAGIPHRIYFNDIHPD